MASPLTVDTEDIIQYPNSEHSFQLSSPPTIGQPNLSSVGSYDDSPKRKTTKKNARGGGKRKNAGSKKGKAKRRKSVAAAEDKEIIIDMNPADTSDYIVDDSIDDIDASVVDEDLPLTVRKKGRI